MQSYNLFVLNYIENTFEIKIFRQLNKLNTDEYELYDIRLKLDQLKKERARKNYKEFGFRKFKNEGKFAKQIISGTNGK